MTAGVTGRSAFAVFVTGPDLRPVTQRIETWQDLDVTLRDNAVSSGSMTVPATSELLTAVSEPNNRVLVVRKPVPALGIPGSVLISGPIEKPGAYRWSTESQEEAGPGMMTVGWADNLAYLAERRVYPNPALASTSQDTDFYTAAGVNAEVLMRTLVHLNGGAGALPARQTGVVLGALAGVGGPVDLTAAFDPMLDVLRFLALSGGDLAFGVRETSGRQLLFEVWQRPTRVDARFGRDRGNLTSLATDPDAPTATVAIVGGAGSGAARLVVERDAAGPWRRMETYVSQDGVESLSELEAYGDQTLAEKAERVALTAGAIDGGGVLYGVNYRVGDQVPVGLAHGVTRVDTVTSLRVQATAKGAVTFTPTIGATDASSDTALVRLWRETARRINRIETRR